MVNPIHSDLDSGLQHNTREFHLEVEFGTGEHRGPIDRIKRLRLERSSQHGAGKQYH
jgi:hypothetical protein